MMYTFVHLYVCFVDCVKVTIPLTNGDTWYKKLKEAIEKSQMERIWMSETKVVRCFIVASVLFHRATDLYF